jgi:2-polyprenyl-3-methyl-5-hydroxy-6-metoxy-1,4-benzoquinol methylase
MSEVDREKWDRKYAARRQRWPGQPAEWLQEHLPQLRPPGRALDLAAGDGCNSLLLASRGWTVDAVDVSAEGFAIGKPSAGPLPIRWIVADLDDYQPPPAQYDLVLCFKFLDRARLPDIVMSALKPGGLFLAETVNWREGESPDAHVTNPDYLLQPDEWPALFPTLQVLEHDQSGTTSKFAARRPDR